MVLSASGPPHRGPARNARARLHTAQRTRAPLPFDPVHPGRAITHREGPRSVADDHDCHAEDGRLHGVAARASGAIDTSSRSPSVPPCRGGAVRPWRHFQVLELWNRPRYALTAPVALVRGYCVTPGLWGFPVGPNE